MTATKDGIGAGSLLDPLLLDLARATQAAAVACLAWIGRGDRKAADHAAVEAMRAALAGLPAAGRVVIGEGEKDAAPMLFAGEAVGSGAGPRIDLAVDPLEGTNFCAHGLPGAISVLAAAPAGALWATPGYYMDKLVVGRGARGAIDLGAPPVDNLRRIARALGKAIGDLTIVILDKPRHRELIAAVRGAGARVREIRDGDVMGSLTVLLPGGPADACLGIGGAPEGVITACAARLLGGEMQGRLAPQSDAERERLNAAGARWDEVLATEQLVTSADCAFLATAVTDAEPLAAPRRLGAAWMTHSLVVSARSGVTFVHSERAEETSP